MIKSKKRKSSEIHLNFYSSTRRPLLVVKKNAGLAFGSSESASAFCQFLVTSNREAMAF